jgi:inosine-uridine nucleoside N-ribohydrolase
MGGYLHPVRLGRRDVQELNLSADPEASFQVLNAPCPVVLMNAQICLQTPFTWRDYRKLKFWSQKTRRWIRQWLILHRIFCGLGNFYLWDLLPAICISYPDLFVNNQVIIDSSVIDLESGMLLPRVSDKDSGLNMPVLVNDLVRFKEVLFQSWRKIPV